MRPRLLTALSCCLLGLAVPGHAAASATQESTFQDDPNLVFGTPAVVAKTMDKMKALGADRLRISVFWKTVAPAGNGETKPAFDATDPAAYPAGAWDRYDTIVRLAQQKGLLVNFDVTSPAPHWATGSLPGRPDLDDTFDPNPKEFGAFVQAVGKRYSGTYVPPGTAAPGTPAAPAPTGPITLPRQAAAAPGALPRVDSWAVWNEPNQPGWLTPQWADDPRAGKTDVETAPRIYRSLLDVMYAGLVATGHQADTILVGETAPTGQPRLEGPTRALKPGRFIRQLYCLDDNLQFEQGTSAQIRGCPVDGQAATFIAAHPGLFAMTGYAHHPYDLSFAPDRVPRSADDFTVGNLNALSALLRRVFQRYGQKVPGSGKDVPLYLTEFGYQTDPPDPSGISFAKQAAYLNEAEWLTYRRPEVRTLSQFLLVDDRPDPGIKDPVAAYGRTFQSGLETLGGKVKPAELSYATPIFLPERKIKRGAKLRVFGLLRAAPTTSAPTAFVQLRGAGGTYKTVKTVKATARRGYVDVKYTPATSGVLRLAWRSGGKLVTSRQVSFSVAAPARKKPAGAA